MEGINLYLRTAIVVIYSSCDKPIIALSVCLINLALITI